MKSAWRWPLWIVLLGALGSLVALDRSADAVPTVAGAVKRPPPSSSSPERLATDRMTVRPLVSRDELIPQRRRNEPVVDLFASRDWSPPAPVAPPPPLPPPVRLVPAAPPAPQFTYLGKRRDEQGWQVYLGRGELSLIVREGETIEGGYRVESIRPPALTLVRGNQNDKEVVVIGEGE